MTNFIEPSESIECVFLIEETNIYKDANGSTCNQEILMHRAYGNFDFTTKKWSGITLPSNDDLKSMTNETYGDILDDCNTNDCIKTEFSDEIGGGVCFSELF